MKKTKGSRAWRKEMQRKEDRKNSTKYRKVHQHWKRRLETLRRAYETLKPQRSIMSKYLHPIGDQQNDAFFALPVMSDLLEELYGDHVHLSSIVHISSIATQLTIGSGLYQLGKGRK